MFWIKPPKDSKSIQAIEIKKAHTKQQKTRNYFLVRASALLAEHAQSEAKIVWSERHGVVNDVIAFQQDKNGFSGIFMAPFSALTSE